MNPELAFLSESKKKWVLHLIFMRIPKNASTSLFHHLGQFNLIKKYEQSFFKNISNPLYKNWFDPTHAKPDEVKSVIPVNPSNYFSFGVVRNPWDRFVSMYSFMIKEHLWKLFNLPCAPSFKEFCEIVEEKWDNQDKYFFPTQEQNLWLTGAFEVQKVLRFENLRSEFADMLEEIGAIHISKDIPHLNSSEHEKYQNYFDNYSKKLVEKIYQKDIELFKYEF